MAVYVRSDVGSVSTWHEASYTLPDSGMVIGGKQFLNDALALTGCEISVNGFKPGEFFPFDHFHLTHEETFIIVQGEGEFEVDDQRFTIKEGDVIHVSLSAIRNICNTSEDTILNFIVIQTKQNSMNSTKVTEDGRAKRTRDAW